jgi:transcriptional regulator with XRE-family HTH domain
MFKKKTYRSVVEMARDVGGDAAFADDLGRHIAERRLVGRLSALRCARGLSQKDVAERMGCTQGRVSKLEASRDDDLSLGDIRSYALALGLTTVVGLEGGQSAAARVKFHHARIKSEVDRLTKLAVGDETIAAGIARFFDEAAVNFLTTLEDATKKLPAVVPPPGNFLEIVAPEDEACAPEPAKPEEPRPLKPKRSRTPKASVR